MTDLRERILSAPADPPLPDHGHVESWLNRGVVVHHPIDESAYIYSDFVVDLEDQADPVERDLA